MKQLYLWFLNVLTSCMISVVAGLMQPFDGKVEMYKGNNFKVLALTAGFSDTSFTTSLVVFSTVIFQYKSYKGRVQRHL